MKIWNTKYALSEGITVHEAEQADEGAVKYRPGFNCFLYGEGKEWHRTREGAIARAEEMRVAKLKLLDKQAKKIAAIDFEKTPE